MNEEFGDVKKLAAEKFPGQFSSNEEMLFTLTMDGLTVHMFGLPGDPFTVCVRTRVLSMDTVPRAADFARAAIAGNFFWGGTRGATLSVAADDALYLTERRLAEELVGEEALEDCIRDFALTVRDWRERSRLYA
ncbi:MAG: type III secretion system chaperone [Deltaproteobacteria bacterium]|nr:type III secretion system chaperone [Deltaproteobacteria bacterium]